MDLQVIEKLKRQLNTLPLPGKEAQYAMAHAVRQSNFVVPDNKKTACTLALLYPKDELHLALIQRPSHNPNDRHGGQISFPGGQVEAKDSSLADTAIRETHEEIGVSPDQINLIGSLSELYIPVSNFMVYPFVAYTERMPEFNIQPSEVDHVIEVPIKHLLDTKNIKKKDMQITDRMRLREVPFFDVQGKVVWGATAMMLNELLTIWKLAMTK